MSASPPAQILENLWWFRDLCNVFLLRRGDRALAIDFGSGRWWQRLPELGIRKLDHVLLTHHHADQCVGLCENWPDRCQVHAPVGEERFLRPAEVRRFWRTRRGSGCPSSYSVLEQGLSNIRCDMAEGRDLFWNGIRIRFLPTPGHGPNAHSIILNWRGKQVVFCGDAAYAGGKIWQPYHLEWDHWTGAGALAAYHGVSRLALVGMDLLCPAHGPVVAERPAAMLRVLRARLMAFYESKLSICPEERDEFWPAEPFGRGAKRVLPHLYHFGANGYMLLSERGEALIIDPHLPDLPAMESLRKRLGEPRIAAAISSHYHLDHCDGIPTLQKRFGARAFLHPWVALPLRASRNYDVPWLPSVTIRADELLPERGVWEWNEYRFRVAPFPGQTWWHAAYQAEIDGMKIFFGGDNFQPNSRWNGTGGYCAMNGSHFRRGFIPSARLVLDWSPDLLCNGHGTFFKFRPSRFEKIRRWALKAERAVAALCPTGDLERDYYLHRHA